MILGIGVLLVTVTQAQSYEINFTGIDFDGHNQNVDYYYPTAGGYVYQPTSIGNLYAPVHFPVSASGLRVSRFSVTYYDFNAAGYVRVELYKKDRWNGGTTLVAQLQSSAAGNSSSIQFMNLPKSQMTATGIDNNRYAWFMLLYFSDNGSSLRLHQVTIRYE